MNKPIEEVEIIQESVQPVVKFDVTEEALVELEEKYKRANLPDIATKEGYQFYRLGLSNIRAIEKGVEDRRKLLNEDALAWQRKVNATAKSIRARITPLKNVMKEIKSVYDAKAEAEKKAKKEAEARRRNDILQSINAIRETVAAAIQLSSSEIRDVINDIKLIDTSKDFDEFSGQAQIAKEQTIARLADLLEATLDQERKEKKMAEEKAALEEQRKKLEAAKAEQRKVEEANRAAERERERIAAEKLAKERAEHDAKMKAEREELQRQQAEIARKEKEEQEKKEAAERIEREKKEKAEREEQERQAALADEKRQNQIREEVIQAIQEKAGSAACPASALFEAIKAGEIPHVVLQG